MNRTAVIVASTVLMCFAIAGIVVLSVTNHDASALMGWIAATVIPSVVSLFAYNEAGKARQNTNGLLHATIARAEAAENKLASGSVDSTRN